MTEAFSRTAPGDGELLFRLSRGDEPAYRLLHDRHQAAVFEIALLLSRSGREAEEAAATAFFELWRALDKVRLIDDSALPWLLFTTARVVKSSVRSRRRYRRLLTRIPDDAHSDDHAGEVARVRRSLDLSAESLEGMRGLGFRDLGVAILCLLRGVPPIDAAVVLGMRESAVRSRLTRLTTRLGDAPRRYASTTEATA
nr:sigma factor [uncultured Microbacterium sp.]